jgi:hypothetical protein
MFLLLFWGNMRWFGEESSRFFEKKRRKKLLLVLSREF